MKKLLITLGTVAAITAPLVSVISCSEKVDSFTIEYGNKPMITYKVENFDLNALASSREIMIKKVNDEIENFENKLTSEEVKNFARLGSASVKWTNKNISVKSKAEKYIFSFETFITLGNVRIKVIDPFNIDKVKIDNVAASVLQKQVFDEYKKKLRAVIVEINKINKEIADKAKAAKTVVPKPGQTQQIKIG